MSSPSYWMLADTEVPLAWDHSRIDTFSSYFKHALLFNEKLMLSDAQAVNCMNFRRLVTQDNDFRQVLDKDILSVAVRAPETAPQGHRLTTVRDAFVKEGKQRTDIDSEFINNTDLDLINEKCDVKLYNYEQLRDNYTQGVLQVFHLPHVVEKIGHDGHSRIVDLLQAETERNNGLGRIFLQDGLGKILRREGHEQLWQQHQSLINKLSDAPYVTGIPMVMEAAPVYSPIHQEAFDLITGHSGEQQEQLEKGKILDLQTGLRLSTYEHALAKLSVEDVFYLRSTKEFRTYQKLSQSVVTTEKQLDDVIDALGDYQRLIDHIIIRRHLGKQQSLHERVHRKLQMLTKVSQETGAFSLGLALGTDILTSGSLTMANFFVSHALDKYNENEERARDRNSHRLMTELKRSGKDQQIAAERKFKDVSETVYTSVS
ncbi:MAG: hypothetical protein ACQEVQ_10545 [Pseudomonadota bacterium]